MWLFTEGEILCLRILGDCGDWGQGEELVILFVCFWRRYSSEFDHLYHCQGKESRGQITPQTAIQKCQSTLTGLNMVIPFGPYVSGFFYEVDTRASLNHSCLRKTYLLCINLLQKRLLLLP